MREAGQSKTWDQRTVGGCLCSTKGGPSPSPGGELSKDRPGPWDALRFRLPPTTALLRSETTWIPNVSWGKLHLQARVEIARKTKAEDSNPSWLYAEPAWRLAQHQTPQMVSACCLFFWTRGHSRAGTPPKPRYCTPSPKHSPWYRIRACICMGLKKWMSSILSIWSTDLQF